MRRLGWIGLWVCQLLMALTFVLAGGGKFRGTIWARMFARWGYPDHFYLVIGGIEVLAGLALLVPRIAAPAALMLIVIMMGAGLTHAMHGEERRLPEILIISLFLCAVAYGRWPNAMWHKIRQ
jgi:uncharacterized membrane protein YphA (DoxX/SURF4 family)